MKTNKKNIKTLGLSLRLGVLVSVLIMLSGAAVILAHVVHAEDFQPLIDAVTKQIQDNQAQANQKQAEADTLQNHLDAVQDRLQAARANLQLTRLKIDQTKQNLTTNKTELERQTELLRENIAAVYREGGLSPMELLASSDTLSDLVSKQQYYGSLRDKITGSVNAIKQVKHDLEISQSQLQINENEEQLEEDAITAQETELAALVEQTRGEESAYRSLVDADKTRLATLRAQQSAAIAAQSTGREYTSTTEYPWASVDPFPSSGVDPWGFYYRQCTSYAAWRRANINRPLPSWGFLGPANAKQWPDWARQFQMRVDSQPEVGAIAVYPVGEYGHVMIVEAIVKNGQQVLVSEFNANWDGRYSQSLWPVSALVFIH